MVAYPGAGADCAGTVNGAGGLPALQARPYDAAALLASRSDHAKLVTETNPGYMYDLVRHWPDGVPNGGTVDGTGKSVAALVEHYNGMGSTSDDGLRAVEELIGWVPSRGGVANIGLVRAVQFPSTVTHYVSTDAVWERTVAVNDAEFGGEYGRLWAPRRTYAGRQHDARHLVRRACRLARVTAVHGGQRRTAADARGRRDVPVAGRVHRCRRPHGELRHLQQRVQRQDLRRRRARPGHVRVGVHEHHRARG